MPWTHAPNDPPPPTVLILLIALIVAVSLAH
jgi:hypothetical protein